MSSYASNASSESELRNTSNYRKECVFTPVYSKHSNNNLELELECETATLSIRVPIKYKLMYKKFTHQQKYVFKMGVIGLIQAVAEGADSVKSAPNVVLNLNLNIAKAESSAHLSSDYSALMDRIKQLKEELREVKAALNYYKNRLSDIKKQLQRLRLVLSKCDINTALIIVNKLLR